MRNLRYMSGSCVIKWIPYTLYRHLEQCSGCLGCYTKPKLNSTLQCPFKEQNSYAWTASSTCDMDNGVRSGGCTSAETLTHDVHCTTSSAKSSAFVNHGVLLWNHNREKWIGNKKPANHARQLLEPKLSYNATYDSLLSRNKPFPKSIPLSEMVDFLVVIWEKEGMYD